MKNKKVIIFLTLVLVSLMIASTFVACTSAKNLNVPDAILIDYCNAGGTASFTLPSTLAVYPNPATSIQFRVMHCEIPNADKSFDSLLIFLGFPAQDANNNPITKYQPYAQITTSQEYADFGEAFWHGTFMQFDATLYTGLPVNRGTDEQSGRNNIQVVGSDVLSVERHGNDVTVKLTEPQTIYVPLYGLAKPTASPQSFTLQPFTLELSKYGSAFHILAPVTMGNPADSTSPSWRGASGMTIVHDELRFNANAVLTLPGTGILNGATVTATAADTVVIMNAIHTFYPYVAPT